MPPRQLRPATNTTAPTRRGAHGVRKPERIPTPAAGVRRGGPWSPGRLQPIHPLVDDHARLAYSRVLQRDRDGLKRPSWNELVAYFLARGIITIERVLTNHPPGGPPTSGGCATASAPPRNAPGRAAQRARWGRANRTLIAEWGRRQVFASTQPSRRGTPWLEALNRARALNAERRGSALGGGRRTSRLSPTGWPGTPGSRKTTASHGPPPVDPWPLRRDVPIYVLLSVASTGRT